VATVQIHRLNPSNGQMNSKIVGIMKVSKISLVRAEHAGSMQETLDVIILVGRCCETLR
jgi:hypothetical protein